MTTVRHPHAERDASPAAVTVGTTTYRVDDDGVIECPDDQAAAVADVLADVYAVDPADLLEDDAETCDAIMQNDEVCGRELPCPYHSEED
jgi:hypothetical protein